MMDNTAHRMLGIYSRENARQHGVVHAGRYGAVHGSFGQSRGDLEVTGEDM